jgi:hypothetical protein
MDIIKKKIVCCSFKLESGLSSISIIGCFGTIDGSWFSFYFKESTDNGRSFYKMG